MKITRHQERFVFHLGQREKRLLLDLLEHVANLPVRQQGLTRESSIPDQETAESLLAESLEDQRKQNQQHLLNLFADPARFQVTPTGCDLSLSSPDLEVLLQVLNEIRIGSWVLLGSPEEGGDVSALTPEATQHLWSMEMTGYFQMSFLRAYESRST